ncbi:MAG: hypothetical protein KGL39_00585 [Patescibacteria group bacterium]|nr:hypothetical protein [Patescibacteria group bacterium]
MSSYEERLAAVSRILKEHNDKLGEPPLGRVDPDDFIAKLKGIGGTTEERLQKLSAEDVLHCLPSPEGLRPMPLAKALVKVLRGGKDFGEESFSGPNRMSYKKASQLSPSQLVLAYDPEEPDSPIGKRLKEISKNEPFLVYTLSGSLVRDLSAVLLEEIRQGYPGRDVTSLSDGTDVVPYRVGERPDFYVDENPIYIGRPLRPDGSCDQTNRSWAGVSLEVRQLVRLIRTTEEKGSEYFCGDRTLALDRVHYLMDWALEPDAAKYLRMRFKTVSLKFNELAKIGALPRLKVTLNCRKETTTSGRPFDEGKKEGKKVVLAKASRTPKVSCPFSIHMAKRQPVSVF